MAVGVDSQEIPKSLDGNDGAQDCILLWDNGLEKRFQRFPCTSAQLREESSIIKEVSPDNLGYAMSEDEGHLRLVAASQHGHHSHGFAHPLLRADRPKPSKKPCGWYHGGFHRFSRVGLIVTTAIVQVGSVYTSAGAKHPRLSSHVSHWIPQMASPFQRRQFGDHPGA
jgi:hypothetical protein